VRAVSARKSEQKLEATMSSKAIDLKEKATEYYVDFDIFGRPCRYGVLDRCELLGCQRELAAQGREFLTPFIGWMIHELGYRVGTALQVSRRVWTALYETEINPANKLWDDDLSWSYRQKIFNDLRKYCTFLLFSPTSGEKGHAFAKETLLELVRTEFWDGRDPGSIIERYRPDRR
jgi:hypothetical protein